MKTIYNKFDKKLIGELPIVRFEGRIVVVLSEAEAERAVSYLLAQPILGIDTETKPCFRRGRSHRVALLQVSTHDTCFLFRLNYIGLLPCIVRLLEDERVPKIGLSLHDDVHQLRERCPGFEPGAFVDLQDVVKQFGIEDMSLQKLYANLFGQRIVKRQQLSNWEADVLNDRQKTYAATDAWTCINLYEELMRMRQTGDYQLVECSAESTESSQRSESSESSKSSEPSEAPQNPKQKAKQ